MSKTKEIDKKLYDARAVKRNIGKGYLSDKEYKKFLDALPDMEEAAVPFDVSQDEEIENREERRAERNAKLAVKEESAVEESEAIESDD